MKQCFQYSHGIYVHERPGQAVLTNEVELGLASPACIGKYMKWVESDDVIKLRAADIIIPSCHGRRVVAKLVRWLHSNNAMVRRSATLGLMNQPRTEPIHDEIGTLLLNEPDSIVQFRLVKALARHGTSGEITVLKEYSKRPIPGVPTNLC
jgi:hypothetical protein